MQENTVFIAPDCRNSLRTSDELSKTRLLPTLSCCQPFLTKKPTLPCSRTLRVVIWRVFFLHNFLHHGGARAQPSSFPDHRYYWTYRVSRLPPHSVCATRKNSAAP